MHVASPRLVENLGVIRRRIAEAASRVGRRAEEIKLVAITKYVDVELTAALVAAGCTDIGESRPQELWRKAEALNSQKVNWHLVGHLQRNKVRRTLPLVSWIHSCDGLPLLQEIDAQSASLSLGRPLSVLLEVNISGDTAKHGFAPGAMREVIVHAARLANIRVRGLMAMAGCEGDVDAARSDFRRLRELRDELRHDSPHELALDELSMGMSGDFEVAIEEGATIVRVGSALFEGISV